MNTKHVFLRKIHACVFAISMLLANSLFAQGENPLVLFSPDNNPQNYLITLLSQAKKRIHVAVYMITNGKIAHALAQAKQRQGLDVQCITDESCLESRDEKISFLKNHNIDTFIYPSVSGKVSKKTKGIMHHKFAIIDDCVVTGSFNWTRAANYVNQENIIILNDKRVLDTFAQQFELIKSRCSTTLHKSVQRISKSTSHEIRPAVKKNLRYLFEKIKKNLSFSKQTRKPQH